MEQIDTSSSASVTAADEPPVGPRVSIDVEEIWKSRPIAKYVATFRGTLCRYTVGTADPWPEASETGAGNLASSTSAGTTYSNGPIEWKQRHASI